VAADTDTTPNDRCYAEGLKRSGSHNRAAHMFLIEPADWSWSGTVSGFDPGVLLESRGGLRPPVRGRSPRHLSLVEREEISRVSARVVLLRMVATRLGRGRRRSPGNWPVRVTGSVVGLITLIGQRYPEPDVAKPSKLAEHRGWVGLLRRNSRIGGQPRRQWTNPMPSRSARLRCPVWPVWRGTRLGQREDTLIELPRQDRKLFRAAGWCPPVDGRGRTDPVPG